MIKARVLASWLMGALSSASLAASEALKPSQASRGGASLVSLKAQEIELSLGEAISLGLRDNRAIRSLYLNRIAQKFELRVAQDRYRPQLTISGRYQVSHDQDERYRHSDLAPVATLLTPYGTRLSLGWAYTQVQAREGGLSRNDGATIAVIQPLLRGAGREVASAPLRQARLSEQVNRLALKSSVSRTITQIISGYRDLLRTQEQLQIARDALQRSRQLLEVNRAMIEAGRMAAIEIVQTEAEVATQELAYEDQRNQLQASRLALLQLLAVDLQTQVRASDDLQAQRLEVDIHKALAQAEAWQPTYLAQLIAGEQAEIGLKVARNEQLWDLSLIAGAGQWRDRPARSGAASTWDNHVGIQLEIPLGDLSRRQAEVQAQVDVGNQALQLAEARQQLEREVTNAVRGIDVRWRQFEIAERALQLSRRKLQIEREKLTVGRSSNFQVLSFENDLRNAENSRLNALISYLNAQTELDQTLGTTLDSWDIALND